MTDASPSQLLTQLATGYWVPRCLHAIAELGAADHIGDAPRSAEFLAEATHAQAMALARVLRVLARTASSRRPMEDSATHRPRGCCDRTIRSRCDQPCE
ncbi:MAG: methyltransferase family protein [Steroidobacteraceae bacterium]